MKLGEPPLVEITFLVSPLARLASILMSSPGPVGMFLMFNAAITEPPHLVSGWPLTSDKAVGAAVLAVRQLYEAFTSCAAPDSWNRPQAWSTLIFATISGACVPPYALPVVPTALRPVDRLYKEVRSHTVGSSSPTDADTPLPNCAVY